MCATASPPSPVPQVLEGAGRKSVADVQQHGALRISQPILWVGLAALAVMLSAPRTHISNTVHHPFSRLWKTWQGSTAGAHGQCSRAIMNTENSSGVFTQRCIVHSNTGGWPTLGGGSKLLFKRQRRRSRRQCSPAVEDERATPTKGDQNIKPGQSSAQQLKNALASPRTASACSRQRAVQPPGMGHSVQGTLDQPEAPASSVH